MHIFDSCRLWQIFSPMAQNDYFERVYEIVKRIPEGQVTTYGHIARALGIASGARLVGWALNGVAGSDRTDIPCHRVVNRLGELSGRMHFETPLVMKERLIAEGVTFIAEAVNMERHLWIPE